MRASVIPLLAPLVLFAASAGEGSAQSVNTTVTDTTAIRGVIRSLRPQAEIRVRSKGTLTDGLLQRSPADSLTIRRGGTAGTSVPISWIDSLWSRESRGGRGALIGGVLGAAFLGALGSGVDDVVGAFCDPDYCEKSGGSNAALGAVAGGLSGAVVGLIVGKSMKRWKPRYP